METDLHLSLGMQSSRPTIVLLPLVIACLTLSAPLAEASFKDTFLKCWRGLKSLYTRDSASVVTTHNYPDDPNPIVIANREYLGSETSSSFEPNGYWDGMIFGAGFYSRRLSTSYGVRPIAEDGRFLGPLQDYEFDPKFGKGRRNGDGTTHVAQIAIRLAQKSSDFAYSIHMLPEGLSAEGIQNYVQSEYGHNEDPGIIFLRKFSRPEEQFLEAINDMALGYRNFLRHRERKLNNEGRAREANDLQGRIEQLRAMHAIEVPPNTTGLVYSGAYAPPMPKGAQLIPIDFTQISSTGDIIAYKSSNNDYRLVEIKKLESGAFEVTYLDDYRSYRSPTESRAIHPVKFRRSAVGLSEFQNRMFMLPQPE